MSSAGSLASPPAPPPDWQATAARFGIESPARAAIERLITKRFRDIQSDDIQLRAMHGDMLLDTERVARLLVLFGETEAEAAAHAATIAQVVATSPAVDDGNNPTFTLNAFAFSGEGDPDPFFAALPDILIFGDGVLDALDWIGIGNVGSRAVLGHEFGHHIQYELNLFDSPLTGAEATRRTELMADSYATYWATHARGLSLNAKRVVDALLTFHAVGDCAFAHPTTTARRTSAGEPQNGVPSLRLLLGRSARSSRR